MSTLTEDEIKKVFQTIDIDGNGALSEGELGEGLRKLSLRPSPSHREELWKVDRTRISPYLPPFMVDNLHCTGTAGS